MLLPAIGLVLIGITVGLLSRLNPPQRLDVSQLKLGLGIASGLGLASAVLMGVSLTQLGFNYDTNAYASTGYTLVVFWIGVALAGVGMGVIQILLLWEDGFWRLRNDAVVDIALYWVSTLVMTGIVFFILYVFPRV